MNTCSHCRHKYDRRRRGDRDYRPSCHDVGPIVKRTSSRVLMLSVVKRGVGQVARVMMGTGAPLRKRAATPSFRTIIVQRCATIR